MIAVLTGVVGEKLADVVVLDVSGVGYGIYVTSEDYGRLKAGDKARLYIHEYIREQAHDLFGFLQPDVKALFEQLLDVNGVGPKMALSMLSLGSAEEMRRAISGGDLKFIQQANGVGKRVAERVVVELKDKVGLAGVDLHASGMLQSEQDALKDEAAAALVALGYTAGDASRLLAKIDTGLSTEDRVKAALKEGSR